MATRQQHTRQTKSASSMIGQMVYAHKNGEVIENVKPYNSWFHKVTKDDMKAYAESYGIKIRDGWAKMDIIDAIAREFGELEAKKKEISFTDKQKETLGAILQIISEQGLDISAKFNTTIGSTFVPMVIELKTEDKVRLMNFEKALTYLSGMFTALKTVNDLRFKDILDSGKEA